MHDYLLITGKLAVGLILLIVIIRLLGRKTLDQVTPIDFVTTVIMADMISTIAADDKLHMGHLIGVILTWAALTFAIDYLKFKLPKFKSLTAGDPLLIIKNGVIKRDALKRERITEEELAEMLREKGVFHPQEVEIAVLEISGKISVKKRSDRSGKNLS